MGMTIDEMYDWLYRLKSEILVFMPKEWHEPMRDSIQDAITFSRKYQMMQADYEARLKADMVAMLDELDLRLYELYDDTDLIKVKYVRQAIQQKINALKEQNNESN